MRFHSHSLAIKAFLKPLLDNLIVWLFDESLHSIDIRLILLSCITTYLAGIKLAKIK